MEGEYIESKQASPTESSVTQASICSTCRWGADAEHKAGSNREPGARPSTIETGSTASCRSPSLAASLDWPDGGHCHATWPDGSSYTGQFQGSDIHGHGKYVWADGRQYLGQWRRTQKHGKGSFEWPDGRTYHGQYADDKKEGAGVFTWPNGCRYDGDWCSGLQHGKGHFVRPGGTSKHGQWSKGQCISWLHSEAEDSEQSRSMPCIQREDAWPRQSSQACEVEQ